MLAANIQTHRRVVQTTDTIGFSVKSSHQADAWSEPLVILPSLVHPKRRSSAGLGTSQTV